MSFAKLGLSRELLYAVERQGYTQPTAIQAQAIGPIIAGKDIIAAAQTGTGKTAGFTLPLLHRLSKNKKYLPRILDIDILAFGELQVHTGLLEIPHPGISERKFVLKPWKDIAPDFSVPGFSATVSELLDNTVDPSDISMLLIFDKEDMI